MQILKMYLYDITPDSAALHQTAVEIEVWEGYLLRNKTNVQKSLCTYSLDNGPWQETDDGKLLFRFTNYDWLKNIRVLLDRENMHYQVLRAFDINPLQQLLKKKIFLAEDDPDTAFALSSILEDAGYHVKVSSSGNAIIKGNFSWVDLFILDKRMPDIDGLEICRHLRAQAATRDIPVIMISADARNGDEALDAGASDYIEKPFHMHYLVNLVKRYTARMKDH